MSLTPKAAEALLGRLCTEGFDRLSACSDSALEAAWRDTVTALGDPASRERRALEEELSGHVELTPPALSAALEVILSGVSPAVAARIFTLAERRRQASPALVLLAETPVGLAVQSLLPALARRRPLVLKSARAEPRFTPFLLHALAAREPAIGDAFAALSWEGGVDPIERILVDGVDQVIAYGGASTVNALRASWGEKVFVHGPKLSVALISGDGEALDGATLLALARDVALFEQRGCLSLQLVLVEQSGEIVARRLSQALERVALELPPPPLSTSRALAIQQLRCEAEMRGLWTTAESISAGCVLFAGRLEEAPGPRSLPLQPSPGGRTVLVWEVSSIEHGVAALEPLRGHVQGAVWAGADSAPEPTSQIADRLRALGVTRLAGPGKLQYVDALWPNGGIDPLALY